MTEEPSLTMLPHYTRHGSGADQVSAASTGMLDSTFRTDDAADLGLDPASPSFSLSQDETVHDASFSISSVVDSPAKSVLSL